MIQSSAGAAGRAGAASRLRLLALLLRDEVAVGSPGLARLGLIGLAYVLQTIVLMSPGHFRPAGQWFFAALVTMGTLAALGLTLVAALPVQRRFSFRVRRGLAASALLSLTILSGMGLWYAGYGVRAMMLNSPPSNDGAVMDVFAARQVLHGHNPYIKTNIVAALAAFNAPSTTTTPLMEGQFRGARGYPSSAAVQNLFVSILHWRPHIIPPEFESKYNYPSGSFLIILPFVGLGITDMRFLYALALVGMGAYLWRRMPRTLRPLVPLLILANVPLIILTGGGQPDPTYGLFLMIGYAEWATPWLSPLTMGAAVGTKQLAWFFVPFYLVLVVNEFGWREAARRAAIMAGVFAAINLPFIVQSPSSYAASIAAPMSDPMFPLGVGIIAMFVSGVVPMLPKMGFTVMELVAWLGGFGASIRYQWLTGGAAAVLAALPLFFAWRSLVNYFYLVPLLALAIALAEPAQRRVSQRRRARSAGSEHAETLVPVPVAAEAD